MNYRHIFHAGSFADVFKHSILVRLLEKMKVKENGFCYIDTHAGIGLYDLTKIQDQPSPEYSQGIAKFVGRNDIIPLLQDYYQLIMSVQKTNSIHYYLGSPVIAQNFMRAQDQLILNELHPEDFQALKKIMRHDARVHCHQRNAYEFLPAILPPNLKRAVILIDPAYEKTDEFDSIINAINQCWQRFRQGIYVIWYPIVNRFSASLQQSSFFQKIKSLDLGPILVSEIMLGNTENKPGLIGCGVIILNPPWKIEDEITVIAKYLLDIFRKDDSAYYQIVNN